MKIHIVQKDETLWKIAQKYGVNVNEVIAANPQISNPDMIMPGMKIKIPTAADSKQQPAPSDKKQQVQPGTTDKKDKQEVKPEAPSQILPAIEEDEDKKWEPLKKEMPSLPIHFNKQPPQPVQPAPSQASQDLKWTQLTNNFETHIHPTQMPEDDDHVAGVEDHKKPKHKPMAPHHHHPQPMPMHAPCYSKEGIPYGYGHTGHTGHMPQYPFPEGFQPQVMGEQSLPQQTGPSTQPHQGWYQAQMPSDNQGQQMPWGPSQMPQNQMMPNQQQPMQQMPMQQQPNMPVPMPGEPMIPQPGAPNYPLMPMPYGMQGQQQMPYQPYPQQGMPYGQPNKKDCGCGGNR
ncbi:SafA/ExsA family spore coat assembly protein [Gracilibacillus saliphilus]|uniref:SafA/ExsA family spore coat assembly protein n=1 Tax=Gracilibacillus saliphilus TaxID=543890 RepID=UPI0013D1FE21|nr:SafA/ExsA family spore coat assembly protein [Gracilibacillus saliphilus]